MSLPRLDFEAAVADGQLVDHWRNDGVLVLDGFWDKETVARVRARAVALRAACAEEAPDAVFDAEDQAHAADDWFCTSGEAIRAFFEPGSTEDIDRARRVNKLGHALHDLDPVFAQALRDPRLALLLHQLGVQDPLLVQSMVIFKEPGIGAAVPAHQDATFLRTEPPSVVGLWFALDEATADNGALEVCVGAQHEAIRAHFVRDGGDHERGLTLRTVDARPLPAEGYVAVPAPPGTLVVFHGQLPHRSAHNRGQTPRFAVTLHVVDGACAWCADNWLVRQTPFTGFGENIDLFNIHKK